LEILLYYDGIDVNVINRIEGETPLHKAAAYSDPEIALEMVQILVNGGASTKRKYFSSVFSFSHGFPYLLPYIYEREPCLSIDFYIGPHFHSWALSMEEWHEQNVRLFLLPPARAIQNENMNALLWPYYHM
jgi:hypothetical protein